MVTSTSFAEARRYHSGPYSAPYRRLPSNGYGAGHAGHPIPGLDSGIEPDSGHQPTVRKRIAVACGRCRKRKIRCSGDSGNGGPCQNCKNSGADVCQFLRVASQMTDWKVTAEYGYSLDSARAYHVRASAHPTSDGAFGTATSTAVAAAAASHSSSPSSSPTSAATVSSICSEYQAGRTNGSVATPQAAMNGSVHNATATTIYGYPAGRSAYYMDMPSMYGECGMSCNLYGSYCSQPSSQPVRGPTRPGHSNAPLYLGPTTTTAVVEAEPDAYTFAAPMPSSRPGVMSAYPLTTMSAASMSGPSMSTMSTMSPMSPMPAVSPMVSVHRTLPAPTARSGSGLAYDTDLGGMASDPLPLPHPHPHPLVDVTAHYAGFDGAMMTPYHTNCNQCVAPDLYSTSRASVSPISTATGFPAIPAYGIASRHGSGSLDGGALNVTTVEAPTIVTAPSDHYRHAVSRVPVEYMMAGDLAGDLAAATATAASNAMNNNDAVPRSSV